jgi:rubrerythrin
MITQRKITTGTITDNSAAVQEALHILSEQRPTYRWVCEVCGMLHTGSAPTACDSCGSPDAIVQEQSQRREMSGRH